MVDSYRAQPIACARAPQFYAAIFLDVAAFINQSFMWLLQSGCPYETCRHQLAKGCIVTAELSEATATASRLLVCKTRKLINLLRIKQKVHPSYRLPPLVVIPNAAGDPTGPVC